MGSRTVTAMANVTANTATPATGRRIAITPRLHGSAWRHASHPYRPLTPLPETTDKMSSDRKKRATTEEASRSHASNCRRRPGLDENPADQWCVYSDGVGELLVVCAECAEREVVADDERADQTNDVLRELRGT